MITQTLATYPFAGTWFIAAIAFLQMLLFFALHLILQSVSVLFSGFNATFSGIQVPLFS
jgi:hypothetical protein